MSVVSGLDWAAAGSCEPRVRTLATSPSIIPSSVFATWAQMSGTANRSFSCYGSDCVTFKFLYLNPSGVRVKCSVSNTVVGPNYSKAPFRMEMEIHRWPLPLVLHFRKGFYLWCHKGGLWSTWSPVSTWQVRHFYILFFLHVLESSDPRFLLLIQFLHFLLSAQKEFAAAADCEGKQEFS